ncbi:MAG: conjugal transfer protein TraR [Actinobacteria bacterium]|nr:MAG: conjugal transfer protein TraR [Actinomycetota bacterium]
MSVDTRRFRTLLLEERERVEVAIHNLHAETPGDLDDTSGELAASGTDNHPADTATATLDRELDLSLEENSAEVLAAIDAALGRIDDGTYGICAKCGSQIPEERLEARPWSQLCIDDQRKVERR